MQIEKEKNTKLANMKGDNMPEPDFRTEPRKIREFKEKVSRKRNFMEQSIIHQEMKLKKLEKVRKNVKLALKLKKKVKKGLKNFRTFFTSKSQTNQKKLVEIPSTPHNTGQYLISNYAQVRHEKLFNLSNDYLEKDIYENMIEYAAMDDICVTGGSMKGIINSHLFRRDSDDFSTSLSITKTNNSHVTDDDCLTATPEYNGNYLSMECDCVFTEREQNHFENRQADYYKQKIEEQKKLIELLMHKIKSQNGFVNNG